MGFVFHLYYTNCMQIICSTQMLSYISSPECNYVRLFKHYGQRVLGVEHLGLVPSPVSNQLCDLSFLMKEAELHDHGAKQKVRIH